MHLIMLVPGYMSSLDFKTNRYSFFNTHVDMQFFCLVKQEEQYLLPLN